MAEEITVRFACQHPVVTVASDADADTMHGLQCACGERRIQRTWTRPPRIIARECAGAQMGPLVTHA